MSGVDESKKEEGSFPKYNYKKLFFGFLVVVLLVFAFFYFGDDSEEDDIYEFYNGYYFSKDPNPNLENVWYTNIRTGEGEQRISLRYHPLDLEHIPFDSDVNQYLYLTQLAEGNVSFALSKEALESGSGLVGLAAHDLIRILRVFFDFNVDVAADGLEDYDWVSCDDASVENFVLILEEGDIGVESEPFCARLSFDTANPSEASKVSSLFLYKILGVMD